MKWVVADSSVGWAGLTEDVALGLLVAVYLGTADLGRPSSLGCGMAVAAPETGWTGWTAKVASAADFAAGCSNLGVALVPGFVGLQGDLIAYGSPPQINLPGRPG